jgi:hypothetical protein
VLEVPRPGARTNLDCSSHFTLRAPM